MSARVKKLAATSAAFEDLQRRFSDLSSARKVQALEISRIAVVESNQAQDLVRIRSTYRSQAQIMADREEAWEGLHQNCS